MKFIPSEPQRLARAHLDKHPDTFLLMGMGLGKTPTILDWLDDLMTDSFESKGALIVAPLRVCNLTWPNEVAKFEKFRQMRLVDLKTPEGRKAFMRGSAQLYTVNWESLPLVATLLAQKTSRKVPYDTVIFDESTKAKSNDSQRAAIYRKFCPRVARQIAMTGTPAPNSEADLWGQMMMVDNGRRLGPSFAHFQQTYFKRKGLYKWEIKEDAKERIHKRISDVTLTLRSSEWLDLPDVIYEDVDVVLPADMMEAYREFERELIMELEGKPITAVNAAALVTKLLQFTSGAVYDEDRFVHALHDHKMKALRELAKREKGPLLVAYAYQHEMMRIREAFPEARFMADAKTAKAQTELMAAWNAGKIRMLVAHPKSMAHGLNMQEGGNVLVWLSLTYSKEDYEQMIGRLYRRGQNQVVYVYRLMVPESVDWVVAEALRTKAEREQNLITALQQYEAFRRGGGIVTIDEDDPLGDLFEV
jgi:SNF2 family DNA or RNA helicase